MFGSVHIQETVLAFNDSIVKKISPGILTVKPMKVWLIFLISTQLYLFCFGIIESNILPNVINCYWFSFISLKKYSKRDKSLSPLAKTLMDLKYICLINYLLFLNLKIPLIILDDS